MKNGNSFHTWAAATATPQHGRQSFQVLSVTPSVSVLMLTAVVSASHCLPLHEGS